jgi:HEPN domain-containing protein
VDVVLRVRRHAHPNVGYRHAVLARGPKRALRAGHHHYRNRQGSGLNAAGLIPVHPAQPVIDAPILNALPRRMAGPEAWWQRAREEVEVARSLRATGKRLQAYHHAGQGVEFGLKAVYMKRKGLSSWPDECRGATWHSLPHIAEAAGLNPDIQALRQDRAKFENWLTARDWDSNGRFPGNTPSKEELNDLILAVCHDRDGVMVWLDGIYQTS